MNPSDNNAGFELPVVNDQTPVVEQSGSANIPKFDPSSQPSPAGAQIAASPVATNPLASTPIPASSSVSDNPSLKASALQFAQDKDLIDKEWVNKAKSIVGKNIDDPYKQSEELTLLKADYMKKRFNKTLKLSK